MSDEAEVMEPEVEVNPMQTFVDDILQKNFAGAQSTFNDLFFKISSVRSNGKP